MHIAGRKTLSMGEWVAGIGGVALAVAIPKFAGISQKWGNTIVFTVLVFSGVVIVLRPAWGRREFWSSLIAVFLFHCIVLAVVEQSLPLTSEGPHGLPMIESGTLEGLLILGVLWRRSMRSTRF
jgi:MFS superfamily sulfate permease-like transporter